MGFRNEIGETAERDFKGETHMCVALYHLLKRSCWFDVMPLPDDQWRITVKAENAAWLETL